MENRMEAEPSRKKQTAPDPQRIYGPRWKGFQKMDEVRHMIPAFKEFYFQSEKDHKGKRKFMEALRSYNAQLEEGVTFFPYPHHLQVMKKSWEKETVRGLEEEMTKRREENRVRDLVKVQSAERAEMLSPDDDSLERGTNTLAGLLLNDAAQTLRDAQGEDQMFSSELTLKKKAYALNVFNFITRKVQGKEALKIKRHAEGRETAGFLMELMNRAKAGKIGEGDVAVLKSAAVVDVEANPA